MRLPNIFRGILTRGTGVAAAYAAAVRGAVAAAGQSNDLFTPDYMSEKVGWTDEAELQQLKPFFGYNHYTDRLLQLTRNNVLGADGIVLMAQRRDAPSALAIEQNWEEFTAHPMRDARLVWRDFSDSVFDEAAKWGEVYLCFRRMPSTSDTPMHLRFRYQLLTPNDLRPEYSDLDPSITLSRQTGEPARYHFKERINGGRSVPASEIVQVFWPRRAIDGRGISWFRKIRKHMDLLYLLETGHLEHAIKLARVPGYTLLPDRMYNSLIGFNPNADEPLTEDDIHKRSQQHQIPTSSDGTQYLPASGSWLKIDSALQPAAFQNLRRGAIAGIAVGWGINYNTVASDLAGINFTTGRMAKLEDETFYLELRAWLQTVIERIFEHWEERTFQVRESTTVFKFNYREYKYLDPQKQSSADKIALANGTTSRRRIAARDGNDIDEIFDELEAEAVRMAVIARAGGSSDDNGTDDAGTDSENGGAGRTAGRPEQQPAPVGADEPAFSRNGTAR